MALFDHGSVSLAADSLEKSQPSVSRALCDLEEQLGFKLFERRGRRGMRPTLLGTLTVGWARIILHDMDGADHELEELRARLAKMGAGEE